MKNKFLVSNPQGVFLARCNTENEVTECISNHLQSNKKNYQLLLGRVPFMSEYQVANLEAIPIYKTGVSE